MSLKLNGTSRSIVIDSSILGFEDIVRHVIAEARERAVELSSLSRTNLEAMGIKID